MEYIELANKNLNNIKYNFNKDYSYEVINGNMINNLVKNKSANKNENLNRKKRNNIPSKNFLRTNGFRDSNKNLNILTKKYNGNIKELYIYLNVFFIK